MSRVILGCLLILLLFTSLSCKSVSTLKNSEPPLNKSVVSDKKKVEETVKRYAEAVEAGNVETMWNMLSESLQKSFEQRGLDKLQFMSQAKFEITESNKRQGEITGVSISKIEVREDQAEVEFVLRRKIFDTTKRYTLDKDGDEWKIESLREE